MQSVLCIVEAYTIRGLGFQPASENSLRFLDPPPGRVWALRFYSLETLDPKPQTLNLVVQYPLADMLLLGSWGAS